ncbi:CPBP family intramembrane glutamic endopeptidase [Lacticaseibacillus zeae]|uniref:Type II CAAX endopeptidase family protein n=1 Tax=Lacticaseibacillus zeae subsp. silagei TaxID=3068307 RepID=A0ABD7Z8E8_LACZE|nr:MULTISPECIES: type II CAAX endopeptidase family protein [Lacticaseibacillus]MDE3316539.1 CPBP family intramembrane metalloprotease [Lacticaseibacillus zeae]WLV83337.1 type II CAAX endopeptidase family protein [Lacticaseibacillus sp. NCIMB 15475]WLV86085.1 type II CAAX endopeptidase family protein [Lacticaseibacillus sp. NCIMB 15474]
MKKEPLASQVFVVLVIAFGWSFLAQIVPTLMVMFGMDNDALLGNPWYQVLFLYAEAIGISGMYLYYHKDNALIPLLSARPLKSYLLGWLLGLLFFSAIWGVITGLGGYQLHFVFSNNSIVLVLLFLFGYGVQSMFEELLCRGYVMGYFLKEKRPLLAVVINSAFFAFLHIANPHFDWYAAIGLFLFGILMSELRLLSHNIWLSGAVHAAWNFAEGTIFGTVVSGLPNVGLIIKSDNTTTAQMLTGGLFGIERSSVSIIAHLVAVIVLAFVILQRKDRERPDQASSSD